MKKTIADLVEKSVLIIHNSTVLSLITNRGLSMKPAVAFIA